MPYLLHSLRWAALLTLAALVLLPVGILLTASLFPPGELPSAGQWWPGAASFDSYARAWAVSELGLGLRNSTLLALFAVPLSLAVCSAAALGLSQLGPRARGWWLTGLVIAASLPYTALWLPRFLLFEALSLQNSLIPLIAPALIGGNPLFVLIYYFAVTQLPAEQFAMARLEGASTWRCWSRVLLPQLMPVHAGVGFLALAWFWGNSIDPLIYLRSPDWTTVTLELKQLELLGQGELPVWLAGAVIVSLPLLVLACSLWPWLKTLEDRP